MMPINVTKSDDGNTVTLNISGRFDFSLHKEFRDSYRDQPAGVKYVLNMRNTEYMDSSALGMLLLLREHAGGDNSNITIEGCQDDIRKILTISNFSKLFTIK
jgi:anti-anti-sigma factor